MEIAFCKLGTTYVIFFRDKKTTPRGISREWPTTEGKQKAQLSRPNNRPKVDPQSTV